MKRNENQNQHDLHIRYITLLNYERRTYLNKKTTIAVPVWEKSNLTLEEAAAYFNIGQNKLRELTNEKNCGFVIWVGTKRLIKRLKLEEYLAKAYSI